MERLALPAGNNKKELEPYIFEDDVMSPTGGDEYLLFEVLRTSFIIKDYEKAKHDLETFLSQNRTQETSDRATFYLGEAYYYCANYPQALECFLSLSETYTSLSRKWIESTLNLYEIPE